MAEPIKLLNPAESTFNTRQKLYRDGIELEKGVVITQDFLNRNEKLICDCIEKWSAYPDVYLDLIAPQEPRIKLFPYQRIFLRACMRYTTIYITAARATSKTFLSILAKYLQCIFVPGHNCFIVAPNKNQAAKISKQKIEEIWVDWPLLKNEVKKANFGKDYVTLEFKNNSKFQIVGALDSDRGLRNHSGLIDEVRDQDGDMVSQVILPQLNVSRRSSTGTINPYEKINQQVIFATSAGTKSSYAYEALMDCFQKAIIDPKSAFCIGLDYRIPVMHGLIDGKYVRDLKLSPSYNETTFAAEYMGTWLGGSDESWFNFEKLSKYRKIKNPEWSAKFRDDPNVFYLISADVGRLGDQTVACVFRVNKKNNKFYSTLVYIEVLGRTPERKPFNRQAIDLKKIIARYNPKEVVIDCNGLGVGLADEMIKTHIDEEGNELPAYGFFNNKDYQQVQPKDAINILYSIKANDTLNSQIHGNVYSRLNSGLIHFLITEQEARGALLATKVGQKMQLQDRVKRLLPHEMTTKLFDEMANLRLKRTGLNIVLEQINSRFPKDKYSAFAYGQWRIKELEDENYKKIRRLSGGANRTLIFYTGGR